ncbi:MAG: hypothetical protein M1546_17180, partial [Chloroflexi bacterium]|nr:hypothetical protein [Chloroflexota bacterium]
VDDLCNARGDSHAIIGGRRFGKSSFLEVLYDELIKRLQQVEPGDLHVVPVKVVLQEKPKQPEDVLGQMLHECCVAVRGIKKYSTLFRTGRLLELGLQAYESKVPVPQPLGTLEAEIETAVDAGSAEIGEVRIAFLVDNIEEAMYFEWTSDLFGRLRALTYSSHVKDFARVVFASSGQFMTDTSQKGSWLINVLTPHYLRPFTEVDMRQLAGRCEALPVEVVDEVIHQAGGHPYIAQHLLYYLFIKGAATATIADVLDEVTRFKSDRRQYLDRWWTFIGADGRRAYCALAAAGGWMSNAEVIQVIDDPYFEPDSSLNALCYHGIAERDGLKPRYRISGQLFKEWAVKHPPATMPGAGAPVPSAPQAGANTQQQAGANAIQIGAVHGGSVVIYREARTMPELLQADPERSQRLKPVVDMLANKFSREEFYVLCFNIGINYEKLPPGGLEVQAIQLATALDNANQLQVLIDAIRAERPSSLVGVKASQTPGVSETPGV